MRKGSGIKAARPLGRKFIMSMQHHTADHAVLADSWTLFCPECALDFCRL
jgi:hypothetical protein